MTFLISVNITHHASAQEVRFTPERIMTWPTRSFAGETRYRVVEKSGQRVLQADALGQASARYLERTIDLNATPFCTGAGKLALPTRDLTKRPKRATTTPQECTLPEKQAFCPGKWNP